jgi:hypothetical protein
MALQRVTGQAPCTTSSATRVMNEIARSIAPRIAAGAKRPSGEQARLEPAALGDSAKDVMADKSCSNALNRG